MIDIIFEWNPWWSKAYEFNGIKRDLLAKVIPWLQRKEIVAVIGVRRSGKTTFLYEIIDYLIKIKKVNPKEILFIKADDERIETGKLIDKVLDEYQKRVNPVDNFFLFIDEVQEIGDWQRTLKRIYDLSGKIKIFVSGSNSNILKEDLGSFLAGRFAYFEVFPFSFSEFLLAHGMEIKNETDMIKHKNQVRKMLLEYIKNGAFPEVVLEKRLEIKEEIIRFYFDSIFYRDIVKRKNIRNVAKMEKLVKYSLQNVSNPANFSKIAKLLELTTDSITDYMRALEDPYLLFSINLFEFSYKKQIINPKKVYCIDSGIRNIVGFNFSVDIGRLYENLVFITLRRKNKEIYYWKNKGEVDFLVKSKKDITLIQVCYNLSEENKNREIDGLFEAMKEFKLKQGLVITENYEAEEKIHGKKLKFIPLWKWLLGC